MISYMEGKILKIHQDRILLLAGYIGYEILLPVFVMERVISEISESNNSSFDSSSDRQIALHIYYYQTERQPKPVLIGFNSEDEKEFFEIFISVDAIGPLKAVKAMEKPISMISTAIEQQNIDFLATLKGIGKRTAQKIIAALHGKVSRFICESTIDSNAYKDSSASILEESFGESLSYSHPIDTQSVSIPINMQKNYQQVVDVLVEQLGYTGVIAKKMVSMAIKQNPSISTPEEIFEAVLHGKI